MCGKLQKRSMKSLPLELFIFIYFLGFLAVNLLRCTLMFTVEKSVCSGLFQAGAWEKRCVTRTYVDAVCGSRSGDYEDLRGVLCLINKFF